MKFKLLRMSLRVIFWTILIWFVSYVLWDNIKDTDFINKHINKKKYYISKIVYLDKMIVLSKASISYDSLKIDKMTVLREVEKIYQYEFAKIDYEFLGSFPPDTSVKMWEKSYQDSMNYLLDKIDKNKELIRTNLMELSDYLNKLKKTNE